MNNVSNHTVSTLVRLVCFVLAIGLAIGSPVARAQGPEPPTPAVTPQNPYFSTTVLTMPDGQSLEREVISGPPAPPPGYEIERAPRALPELNVAAGVNILTAPAYDWVFGCSSVSGAMIVGYYDRNGYPNMYTGPVGGGVAPLDNSMWDSWTDAVGYTYPNLPLAASHNGVDGRTTRGSIDDYWVSYLSGAQDPYVTGGWTQHTWSDAIGDYMKTSQSAYGNDDGSTSFYNYTTSATPLTCAAMVGFGIQNEDGTYGRKLFYEARGYTVTDCYSQMTDNKRDGGFSFAQYKAEIDAGRPVMLNLAGHTIVGVGYDDSGSTVYLHDTWDYSNHTMTWGGSYSGMELQSVSIVNLQPAQPGLPAAFGKSAPANGATGQSTGPTLSWAASSGATSYEYCYDTSNDSGCGGSWTSTSGTSAALSGLANGTTYYWQVRARNGQGTTDANSGAWWSFTTQVGPPAAFGKIAPGNGATGQPTNPTLSWAASSGATSYQYCYDTTNDNTCSGTWTSAAGTSATLNGLANATTYYWQVRASNAGGTTYADAGAMWSFTTASASNVLVNPSFELDANNDGRPDSWTSDARFTRSSTSAHAGTYSGKITGTDGKSLKVVQDVTGITAGRSYSFSGWVNIPTTGKSTLSYQVEWRSATRSIRTVAVGTASAATGGWVNKSATLTAPSGATSARVTISVNRVNNTIYVDDLSFGP